MCIRDRSSPERESGVVLVVYQNRTRGVAIGDAGVDHGAELGEEFAANRDATEVVVAGIAAIENVERIAAAEFGVAVLVGKTGGNLGGYPVKEADGNRINIDIGIFARPVAEIFGVLPHAADFAVNLVGKIVCGIDARIVFVVADEGVVLNGCSGVLEKLVKGEIRIYLENLFGV